MTASLTTRDIIPIVDIELRRAVMKAVEDYDLTSSDAWSALDELSSRTAFEALDANPSGIFEGPPGCFQAIGKVYVTLNYGGKRDQSSMSDSYPVSITGTIDKAAKTARVDRVEVNTAAFYR